MWRRFTLCVVLMAVLLGGLAMPAAIAQEPAPLPTHFWLERPIPAYANPRVEFGYPFGWHRRGQSPVHHGVDMLNRRGTPAIAAADGTIYYAGADAERAFGPKPNFYGNLVVIAHDFDAPEGGRVFTLYGHLHTVEVEAGQRVAVGERIGTVGATGIALGSHLHFEVRIGDPDDYFAVRNPELWYAPLPGTGTLIGRMLDVNSEPARGVRYVLSTAQSVFPGYTYIDLALRADPAYSENFVMGDLPAGCYRLRVRGGSGYAYDGEVCLTAGEATFVEIRLVQ